MPALQTSWKRAVRYVDVDGNEGIGVPTDENQDVGVAIRDGQDVEVDVLSGTSLLDLSVKPTGRIVKVKTILSPLSYREVLNFLCIGLNYNEYPEHPILFYKPSHACNGPGDVPIPKVCQGDMEAVDYESEISFVFGQECKDVAEADALDVILGYASSNDVSSRKWQGALGKGGGQHQWSRSKGFDGAGPFGPCLVAAHSIPDPAQIHVEGRKNGRLVQTSGLDDLIFSIPKLVAFLTSGYTIPAGTVVMTGTPHGIGLTTNNLLKDGDRFEVTGSHGLGTLVNRIKFE